MSAIVSLTLTPMMSARLLKHKPESEQSRLLSRCPKRRSTTSSSSHGSRTLRFVLGYQTITLLVAVGTLILTIFLFYEISERILSPFRIRE